jgi:serine/threonine protein kinase
MSQPGKAVAVRSPAGRITIFCRPAPATRGSSQRTKELLLPSTIGSFQIHGLLGMGATAQVYRAIDPSSGSPVAVKVLHPHLADSPDFAARFEREARAARALDHPGIVRLLDYGRDAAHTYLVLEYVPGSSLKVYQQERHNRPMAIEEAVGLAAAVADALAYAHGQGVVHRDVKPSNILLRDGRPDSPVLTDLGIARLLEATVDTASGGTLGTPAYMSPEQGQGRPADARSDIYALGAVLFELVTGQPPFQAESPYAVVLHHVHTPPPRPRDLRPDLPQAVEEVILRALAKDPGDRYQSAAAFAAALRQSLATARDEQRPGVPSPLRRAPKLGYVLAGAGALLVLLLLVAWFAGWLPVQRPWGGAAAARQTPVVDSLILQGPPAIQEAWLDPDVPDRVSAEDPKVHLQGPSTPDRIAYRLALPEMPAGSELLTATLSLHTVPWGEDNRYATVAVYRLLRDWDPATATYVSPWTAPGLEPGVDYEAEPFLTVELDELLQREGWLELDITPVVRGWLAGQPNDGLLVRMTNDSFGMAHLWVYTGQYEDLALRPKLALRYQRP